MTTARLLAGASGYSFKEWKGTFYPDEIKPEEMLRVLLRAPADGRDQQHVLPDAQDDGARELGGRDARRTSGSRSRRRAASRTSRGSRRNRPPSRSGYLYRNLAALGAKRGPVLFQLPPNLKKDLPRLDGVPRPAARRTIAPRSNSATTPGSPTTSTPRSRAPARRCASPSARTTRRRRWSRRRPGATSGCASKRIRTTICKQWARAARGHGVARDPRVLHARADGAGVRAGADAARVAVGSNPAKQRKEAHR